MINILNILRNLMRGTRAITTQSYNEANVKLGHQYFTRAAFPGSDPIANGTSRYLYFKVGSVPAAIKSRTIQFAGEEVAVRTYVAPTGVTGGTDLTVGAFNGTLANNAETTFKQDPTFATKGTEIVTTPEYLFGATQQRQVDGSSIPFGREFIFAPGTEILVELQNVGSGSVRLSYFTDFYEGGFDLPRKEM